MVNLLDVKNLSKSFNNRSVLKSISFHVGQGEIVGFIGPNGAGKSTTMKCIGNLFFSDEGTIEICGYDLNRETSNALSKIGTLIEEPGLYNDLSGMEHIKLFAGLRGCSKEKQAEIISFMDLGDGVNRKVNEYSVGMRQRLGLGLALLGDPEILILDEPMSGLDPTGVFELRKKLRYLCDKKGISILLSSHQLSEVDKMADRILMINEGVVFTPADELQELRQYEVTLKNDWKELKEKSNINLPFMAESIGNEKVRVTVENNMSLSKVLDEFHQMGSVIQDVERVTIDTETLYKIYIGEADE